MKLPSTEQPNPRTRRLDRLPTRKALELLNREDAQVVPTVRRALPQIARAVDAIVQRWRRGGVLGHFSPIGPRGATH